MASIDTGIFEQRDRFCSDGVNGTAERLHPASQGLAIAFTELDRGHIKTAPHKKFRQSAGAKADFEDARTCRESKTLEKETIGHRPVARILGRKTKWESCCDAHKGTIVPLHFDPVRMPGNLLVDQLHLDIMALTRARLVLQNKELDVVDVNLLAGGPPIAQGVSTAPQHLVPVTGTSLPRSAPDTAGLSRRL